MPGWPFRKKKSFPTYSLLKEVPTRCIPEDLRQREEGDDFDAYADKIRADILADRTPDDTPHFAIFLKLGEGLLQLDLQEGRCLLVFTSAMRATDYVSVQAPDLADKLELFSSNARDAPNVIQHFREHADIRLLALDRCPRCDMFAALDAAAMDTADKLIHAWTISLGTMLARCELYRDYARAAAREGELLKARDVALELVGHVTPADGKTHFLLGKLALQLGDKQLRKEAQNFLEFLGQPAAIRELEVLAKSTDWQF